MNIAWVLGTGIGLPVEHLHLLSGEFTIGVNRILESGFDPKVHFFYDYYNEAFWRMVSRSEAKSVASARGKHLDPKRCPIDYLLHWERPSVGPPTPFRIQIHGSSGAAAVRWAKSLGFERINMLGFGGVGHFYDRGGPWKNGERPWPHETFDREREDCARYGGVMASSNPDHWDLTHKWSREDSNKLLEEKFSGYQRPKHANAG